MKYIFILILCLKLKSKCYNFVKHAYLRNFIPYALIPCRSYASICIFSLIQVMSLISIVIFINSDKLMCTLCVIGIATEYFTSLKTPFTIKVPVDSPISRITSIVYFIIDGPSIR